MPRSFPETSQAEIDRDGKAVAAAVRAEVARLTREQRTRRARAHERRAARATERAERALPGDRVRVRRMRRGAHCLACGKLATALELRGRCGCGACVACGALATGLERDGACPCGGVWVRHVRDVSGVAEIPARTFERASSRWHAGRAAGQVARFADAEHCGLGELRGRCVCGRDAVAMPLRCGVTRLCAVCMDRRSRKSRDRCWEAWERYRPRLVEAGVMSPGHKGADGRLDPWRERHLILTAPHDRIRWFIRPDGSKVSGDAAAVEWRIDRLFRAWCIFSRWFAKWCAAVGDGDVRSGGVRPVWWRAFEWTRGADGLGHPHFHVWLVSPMVDKGAFREAWAMALEHAFGDTGNDCGSSPRTPEGKSLINVEIVDASLRRVSVRAEVAKGWDPRDGAKVHRLVWSQPAKGELVDYFGGWSIDLSGSTSAVVQAACFEALEGRRTTQGAAGFLGLADSAKPCACDGCSKPRVLRSVEVLSWHRAAYAGLDGAASTAPLLELVRAPLGEPRATPERVRPGWVPIGATPFAARLARVAETQARPGIARAVREALGEFEPEIRPGVRQRIRDAVAAASEGRGS